MDLDTPKTGMALLCDTRGVIQVIIRDDLGISRRAGPGRPVTALVDSASVEKVQRFLDVLREEKAAFDWELNIAVEGRIEALYFTGSAIDNQYLIVGAISHSETAQLFEGMMRINNQQANALRTAIKDQTTLSREPTVEHSDVYEQLTRLNNELVTAQRELAKKNGELERLYAAEKQRARELNALYQATTALLSTLDLDILLNQILDAVLNATPTAERAAVMLVDRASDRLRAEAVKGCNDPHGQSLMLEAIQRHVEEAIGKREPLIISDLDVELGSHGDDAHESCLVRSAMIAPLNLGDEVFGILELFSAQPHAFTAGNLRLLETFAATATVALRHAQLHAEVQRLAITDPLTGLYNRRGFSTLGQQELKRAQRFGSPLTALMIDLITSRKSTMPTVTPSATRCWSRWPAAAIIFYARRISKGDLAAKNSRFCS